MQVSVSQYRPPRRLTPAQAARLAVIERSARVVGWRNGPVVLRGDGRIERIAPGGRPVFLGSHLSKLAGDRARRFADTGRSAPRRETP
jgi:hypothetical protein